MGGGPASADVVRASCLLTFPEASGVEPVPVDAWYLHAVGRTFLRRLARDRLGDNMKLALLMQLTDPASGHRRYVSVGSDAVLQRALREMFAAPERVLVLHVISLEAVAGHRRIDVRPEINPNVSPEPVAPMGLVFPTLAVEGLDQSQAAAIPEATVLGMSRSFRKDPHEGVPAAGAKVVSWTNDASLDAADDGSGVMGELTVPVKPPRTKAGAASATLVSATDDAVVAPAMDLSAAGAKLISDGDASAEEEIPLARVVDDADAAPADSEPPMVRTRIPEDYVMLELQHGAGLGDVPAVAAEAAAEAGAMARSSTFFISTNWHLQAAGAQRTDAHAADADAASPGASWTSASSSSAAPGGSSDGSRGMEDSFVVLDHDFGRREL